MAIESKAISDEDASKIRTTIESHFADVKAKEIAPSKLTDTLSAFANADGGELFVGIAEDKTSGIRAWNGFSTIEEANAHIQTLEALFPLSQDFAYTFLENPNSNGCVLHVLVLKTRDIKKPSDGIPRVRRGAQNLRVDSIEKLRRLELDKGVTSFESETVEAADVSDVANSIVVNKFMLEVVPIAEPEPWLTKQRLIRDGRPTVASILLFADEPQPLLPKRCGIKVYRYETKDKEGTREALVGNPLTIEGALYDQIRAAVDTTVEMIEKLSVLRDAEVEKVSYPREALHEIITNAVLHRDYSIPDDVHVRIFENRIEVESPGRLPGHINAENILTERFARNGQLVRIINKFPDPPNKDVGEGLNTAFEAMRKLQLKDPTIEERKNSVLVSIRHESVSPPEVIVAEYLSKNTQITNREGRELCHIGSENRMKRIFQKLIEQDIIEVVPGTYGSKTAYQKKK